MSDPLHESIIKNGVSDWNEWRKKNPRIQPDLTHVDLSGMDLTGVDFRGTGLFEANLSGAIIVNSNLRQARLIRTNLQNADLSGSKIWGISVWDADLTGAKQSDLIITPSKSDEITVDDIEVAQFIYLIINNKKLRNAIDTITSKMVLILGRFTPPCKAILDEIKIAIRKLGYVPVLFDFNGPTNQNLTETVKTLAHLSKTIIVDLSDPSCSPYELSSIAPFTPSTQIFTLIREGSHPFAMFDDLRVYSWVHAPISYNEVNEIEKIIGNLDPFCKK